jgi:hypothetical protein
MNRRTFLRSAGAAIASSAIAPALLPAAMLDARVPAQPASASGENLPSRHSLITAVVYDERYRDCRLFADAHVARGAVAFATRGDSAALWYGPLRAHLARYAAQHGAHSPCVVAGLTTEADRHVSLVCGRELTLALLYEGVHDSRRAPGHAPNRVTTVAHRLRAVSNEAEIAAALSTSRELASPSLSRLAAASPPSLALPAISASQAATASPASPSWPASLADALAHVAPATAATRISPSASILAPVSALTPRSPDHPGYLTSWLLGPQPKNRGVSLLK